MSVTEVLRARRSCRSFSSHPLAPQAVDYLVDRARRTPTAGNSQGVEFLVLDTPKTISHYWDTTLAETGREAFSFPGLLRAPLLVVPFGLPDRYLVRYSEPDKVSTGLGKGTENWGVPYWLVDAAFAAMALQMLAIESELSCCFFGLFEHEAAVRERFVVPDGARAVGTVAIGYPDVDTSRSGRSSGRDRRALKEVLHRGSW